MARRTLKYKQLIYEQSETDVTSDERVVYEHKADEDIVKHSESNQ